MQVLFDEHTDSSLLTLSLLCPGAAGLGAASIKTENWRQADRALRHASTLG